MILIILTSFHLPHIYSAIRAANDHEVIKRAPLNGDNRKKVSGSKNNTLSLCQTKEGDRVVTSHRADTLANSHL